MLIDLINSNNYISINLNMINVLGLTESVYCSELLNIFQKALRKNKLYDGFFRVDRDYIFKRTTIVIENQLLIDKKWESFDLIKINPLDVNMIKLNSDLLVTLLTEEDVDSIKKLKENLQIKLKKIKSHEEIQEGKIKRLQNLKDKVYCSDAELRQALEEWVEAIFIKFNGAKFTNKDVELFKTTLKGYSNDVDVALEIVRLATKLGYKECQWAINVYEKNRKHLKETNNNILRVNNDEPKVATMSSVNINRTF